MENPSTGPRFVSVTFLAGFGFGAFAGVALALLAVALVTDPDAGASPRAEVVLRSLTPDDSTGRFATPDQRPRSTSSLDVRLGPGTEYAVIGLLSRGEAVEAVGRSDDSRWLAIRFPPGSAARGWVPVSGLDGISGLDRLAVALPTPLPRTVVTIPAPSGVGGRTPTPESTTGPRRNFGPPDLVVSRVALLRDGRVSVTVTNRGPGDIVEESIFVQVRTLSARQETMLTQAMTLVVGASVTLETTIFRVEREEIIQAIANPIGSVKEADETNNLVQVTLTPPLRPTPTALPLGEE